MELNPTLLARMIRKTIIAPRAAAAEILGYGFAPVVGWISLVLMAILSSLVLHLSLALMPPEMLELLAGAFHSPIQTAITQWLSLLLLVAAVHWIGRWRGGQGMFCDAVLLVGWMQFVLFLLQLAQLVLLVLAPVLGIIPGLISIFLFFKILSNFVAELHGFESVTKTFFSILMAMILFVIIVGAL